jgi:hypothetical protein
MRALAVDSCARPPAKAALPLLHESIKINKHQF